MPTLFQITDDLLALAELCNDHDGDIDDPATIDALNGWFAELEQNQGEKLDSYIGLIRQWEMEGAAAKEEAERWEMKARVRENRIRRLKERLAEYMSLTSQPKITTAAGRTLAVQKNGGVAPIVPAGWEQAVDLDAYPAFTRKVLDQKAVRKALEEGFPLPFASIGDRGFHVRIR